MRDDAQTAIEKKYKFEADFIAKVERARDEVGQTTKQLRQQVA